MKLSVKSSNSKINSIVAFAVLLVICMAAFSVALFNTSHVALADDAPVQPADTFSVEFPTDYIPSENPTLIAANANYLVIYDEVASALYVQGKGIKNTRTYFVDFELVKTIKVVGNSVFIYADGDTFTVDLTNALATPVQHELPSPQSADYFRSDGTYLYARNIYGAFSVYDEHMQLASIEVKDENGDNTTVTIDNYTYLDSEGYPIFMGREIVLAVYDRTFYLFSSESNKAPLFTVFDPFLQTKSDGTKTDYITEAYVGNNVVVGQLAERPNEAERGKPFLVALNKVTGRQIFKSEIVPDSFCVYADRLFTIEGKQIITYSLDEVEIDGEFYYTGFKKLSTVSMAGNDAYHLDTPSDIIPFGTGFAVADTNNARIAYIGSQPAMTSVSLGTAPLKLAADMTGVYALCANDTIIKVENNKAVQTLTVQNAVDIACLAGKLYILKTDGLYASIGTETVKLAAVQNGRRLACAKDGTNIYVLKDDGIDVYSTSGELINQLHANLASAVDFAVDYAGQIVIMRSDGYDIYENDGTLTLKQSTPLKCEAAAKATVNSVCIYKNSVYFSAKECLIGKVTASLGLISKDDFVPSTFEPSADMSYHFAKLKDEVKSYVFPADGNIEAIYPAPKQTVLVFDSDSENAYALLDGNCFVIRKADYEQVQINALNDDYATKQDTELFALPSVSNGKISVNSGVRVELVSDCADFENAKWLRVRYNSHIYFVAASDVEKYVEIIPEEEKVFGKAKAHRVGGLVNIYAEANDSSAALTQIVDGTKVEVLDTLDGFYLVRYEDIVGYMVDKEVQLDGLTTVQIIAIAVACFVAVAGIGVFIAIEVTKKKADQNAHKAERRNERK